METQQIQNPERPLGVADPAYARRFKISSFIREVEAVVDEFQMEVSTLRQENAALTSRATAAEKKAADLEAALKRQADASVSSLAAKIRRRR